MKTTSLIITIIPWLSIIAVGVWLNGCTLKYANMTKGELISLSLLQAQEARNIEYSDPNHILTAEEFRSDVSDQAPAIIDETTKLGLGVRP